MIPPAEPGPAEHHPVDATDGIGRAVLRSADTTTTVEVSWTADTLPRLNTWTWPAHGAWVLGVEPSNAPLFGAERELEFAGAPVLAPGAQWRTGIRVAVRTGEPR